jgi:D-amino-acid dehydrogenase
MKIKTDVIIIGGGIIGLACAYYLLKEGKSVRIIERDKIGTNASAGNCGFIFSSHILPLCLPGVVKNELKRFLFSRSPLIIKPGLDIPRLIWLWNFAKKCNLAHLGHAIKVREEVLRHSKMLYQSLFSEEMFECEQKQNGILLVFENSRELEKYAKSISSFEHYDLSVEQLTKEDALKLEPGLSRKVCGGIFFKKDFHVRPEKLVDEFRRAVIREGAILEEDCELKGFSLDNQTIIGINTSRGSYVANEYVLAAGAWTSQILKLLDVKIPVQPGKGYCVTVEKNSLSLKTPCIFYEKRVAFTPWENACRAGGFMEFSGFNPEVLSGRIRKIRSDTQEYLSEPLGDSIIDEWAGFRPMCYDDIPIIGRPNNHKNLLFATGHGSTGLSMAPGTGKLVTEIIIGRKPYMDVSVFSPNRF